MNIYKISQSVNNSYDTYDSAIVVAKNTKEARAINPAVGLDIADWAEPQYVSAKLIGRASEDFQDEQVILSSFNAG